MLDWSVGDNYLELISDPRCLQGERDLEELAMESCVHKDYTFCYLSDE